MEEKLERMNAWFDAQIAACAKQRETLLADDRADEADFEKIKANIYDIFRTVLKTAAKESPTTGNEGAEEITEAPLTAQNPPQSAPPTSAPISVTATQQRPRKKIRAKNNKIDKKELSGRKALFYL